MHIKKNVRLTDLEWCQFTFTIRFDGLGIRRISAICFLSSIHGIKKLVSLLLNSNELFILHYYEASAM
jgi:hypothetical protein